LQAVLNNNPSHNNLKNTVINQNPLTSTTLVTHTANLSNNNARNSLQDSGNENEINSDSSSFSDDSQLDKV
jgi:hypothetical protein